MQTKYDDFIGIYTDIYPEGYCEHMIDQFDISVNEGAGSNRQKSENAPRHAKDDMQLFLAERANIFSHFNNDNVVDIFHNGLQNCFDDYTNKFSILKQDNLISHGMKLQRTGPGGGYHIWHCEDGGLASSTRVLVYLLYLNDLDENDGGETEFLYQRKRYRPQKNTMIIWPANFAYAHRGNTVLGNINKYIITGWFYQH